jgi:hypothetical protein
MLAKETIPDLKQSVEKLKSKIYQDMAEQRGTGGPYPYSFVSTTVSYATNYYKIIYIVCEL